MNKKQANDRTIDRINKDILQYNIDVLALADICKIKPKNLKRILDKKYPAPYDAVIAIHKHIRGQREIHTPLVHIRDH